MNKGGKSKLLEREKKTITRFMTEGSGGSYKSCVRYWNSNERSCVFMPHFWDPSFDFVFKALVYACERARGLYVRHCMACKGIDGEDVLFFDSIWSVFRTPYNTHD